MEEVTQELNDASIKAFEYTKKFPEGPVRPPVFEYNAKTMCITLLAGMIVEFPPELETVLGLSSSQNSLIIRLVLQGSEVVTRVTCKP
jgi:hypothetical protein